MACALSIRKTESSTWWLFAGVVLIVPLLLLLRFWIPRGVLHADGIRINFFLHTLLIVWPLLLGFCFLTAGWRTTPATEPHLRHET